MGPREVHRSVSGKPAADHQGQDEGQEGRPQERRGAAPGRGHRSHGAAPPQPGATRPGQIVIRPKNPGEVGSKDRPRRGPAQEKGRSLGAPSESVIPPRATSIENDPMLKPMLASLSDAPLLD